MKKHVLIADGLLFKTASLQVTTRISGKSISSQRTMTTMKSKLFINKKVWESFSEDELEEYVEQVFQYSATSIPTGWLTGIILNNSCLALTW